MVLTLGILSRQQLVLRMTILSSKNTGNAVSLRPCVPRSRVRKPDLYCSPTQRPVLLCEPSQRTIKIFRREVRPLLVHDIDIGVSALHRRKPAESTSTAPAHDQVHGRYILRSQGPMRRQPREVPVHAVSRGKASSAHPPAPVGRRHGQPLATQTRRRPG